MRSDEYPRPVSDPEADGLPDTADDDSTAWDDVRTGRWSDGPDPSALPADHPVAVDRYGTTPAEQSHGPSLDERLAQERPDGADSPPRDRLATDVDDPGPAPHLDSQVSMYDRDDLGGDPDAGVGRLVAPDQGSGPDLEADEIARDAGAAGGGPSAEELAMHETGQPG